MATINNLDVFLGGVTKVYNEKWQADVILKAGNSDESKPIYAHKLVLAARSEVFKKMLESDTFKASLVGKIEKVTISDMKQEELEAFVEFIYSNRSMLSEKEKKHARSLFVAADKYEIPHLRDLCRKELISSLKCSNAIDYLELSLIHSDKALKDSAAVFAVTNLMELCDSKEFKLFVGRNPGCTVQIMKSSRTKRWSGKQLHF